MTENEKIELFDKWYDENYDEWAEGEEGIALREELEQAFKGGIEALEKESAELNERLLKVENAYKRKSEAEWRLNDLYQKVLTDFANAEKCSREYFTRYRTMSDFYIKAKELIERLLITSCNSDVLNLLPNCSEVLRVRVEAEQFLKGDK